MRFTEAKLEIIDEHFYDSDYLKMARELAENGNDDFDNYFVLPNEDESINQLFKTPYEALMAIHFGSYSPNDDYVTLDDYANLKTMSESDLGEEAGKDYKNIIEAVYDAGINGYADEIDDVVNENLETIIEYEIQEGDFMRSEYDPDEIEEILENLAEKGIFRGEL